MLRITESPVAVGGMTDTVDLYEVKVNGHECDVHQARVSAMPFNRTWPGKQRPIEQSEIAAFISFETNEAVALEVKCKKTFKKAFLRPLSSGIVLNVCDDVIKFSISKNGAYVLELDDEHEALHIFVNDVIDYDGAEEATYVFGPGVHFPGLIRLNSNESVYVDRGAIVYGSIFGEDVENIHIFGQGIIDGSYEERLVEHCYKSFTKGNLKFYDSKNIRVEGVILRNSAIWSLNLFHCSNVHVNDIKIIGQWRYNTDGIDVCNCNDVLIENSFIRVFDDVITIKGIPEYMDTPIKNIHVRNCVMWCGWGRTCEVGIETIAPEFSDILFEYCDLIHNSASCLDIQNGGIADVHDVRFENINVEYQKTCMPEVYQESDDMVYDTKGMIGMPCLIYSDNYKYIENEINNKYGKTHDVLYKNIHVYLDDGLSMPKIHFNKRTPDVIHRGFTIDGLYVNGVRIEKLSEMDLCIGDSIEDIVFL